MTHTRKMQKRTPFVPMRTVIEAASGLLLAVCLVSTGFAASGTASYNRLHNVTPPVQAPQAARRLVPGMRVIKQIMGYRLTPPVILMPGMRIIRTQTFWVAEFNCQQVCYNLISNQPAAKIYNEYQKFYGNDGDWEGNVSRLGNGYAYYPFNLRVPPSGVHVATFTIGEHMPPEDAGYVGPQQAYVKSYIGFSLWVPIVDARRYQQKHHGAIQYPLPVDPAR